MATITKRKFVIALAGLDAGRRDSFDRRLSKVDKTHVFLIENLKVVLFQRRSFHSERMRWIDRRQFVRDGRICDPGSRLVAPELVSGVVCFFVR